MTLINTEVPFDLQIVNVNSHTSLSDNSLQIIYYT